MSKSLRLFSFVVVTGMLIISVVYGVLKGEASIVGWYNIILVFLMVFLAVGERFTHVTFSPQGMTIEQNAEEASKEEKAVKEIERDVQTVERFVQGEGTLEEIIDLIEDSIEYPRDTWSKLLLIRITLRHLLRNLAKAHGLDYYGPTASLSRMTADLHARGIIDAFLAEQIEKMRSATFTVEWGGGEPPQPADVKFTLESYAKVFSSLKERASSIQSTF